MATVANEQLIPAVDRGRYFSGLRRVESLLESYVPTDAFAEAEAMVARGSLREAMHSDDLPILLAGTTDIRIRDAYKAVEQPWKQFVRSESFSNFREHKIIGDMEILIDDEQGGAAQSGRFPMVPEGHGYDEARASEYYEVAQLATYGATFSLPRQMIINDDTRSLARIPQLLGRAMARTLNWHVAQVLEANASTTVSGPTCVDGYNLFGTSNHANMVSDALPLSAAAVEAQMVLFGAQETPEGITMDELGIQPKYLIVPSALRLTAQKIVADAALIAGTDTVIQTSQNILTNLVPVSIPNLSSDVDWYLAADPADYDTIEVAYLNGREEPEVFTQALDSAQFSDADGQLYKIRHDWDVYPAAYCAMRKVDDTT
jgi:hypothetical protein